MSSPRAPRPPAAVVLAWSLAAAAAGLIVGTIDGLISWNALSQFAPSFLTRLRTLVYTALLYGLVSAGLAILLSCSGLVLARKTALEQLLAGASRRRRDAELRGPSHRVSGVAHAIAAALCIPAALGLVFRLAYPWLAHRQHIGLVVAVSMAMALAAALLGVVFALVLGRLLEPGLRWLARRRSAAVLISAPLAPMWAAVITLAVLAAVALRLTWSVSQHLPLRTAATAAGIALATISCRKLGGAMASRALAGSRTRTAASLFAFVAVSLAALLAAGASESVQKGAGAYTGLARSLGDGIRKLVDFDRDGFSPLLSGGDCNDFDATVHPGASDQPGDGIDQNCIGGDPSLSPPSPPTFFAAPKQARSMSVVLITIDTLRADHLGAYGYPRNTSPRLDELAAQGTVFENAWAHAPSTRYSMPSILTGRYPLSAYYDTTVQGWPGLQARGPSLGATMKAAGHKTGAVLNYWYFDRVRSMDRGFDEYDNSNQRLHKQGKDGPAKTTGSSSRQQTDRAIRFLQESADAPFFLWVHYYDPHYAYEKHKEVESFGDAPIDLYDNEIRYTDLHIGRLLDELTKLGIDEQTAIVVTGDHGEGFGEHGVDLHGYHLYAAQTRVPLIMRIPGAPPVRATMPVGHIDILPTLANLVGAPTSALMQGRSLLGAITGKEDPHADRWIFQQLSYENNNEIRAAANKSCHVVFRVSPQTTWELYAIARDPKEERDIIGSPGECSGARQALARWYDQSEIPDGAVDAVIAKPSSSWDTQFGDNVRLVGVSAPARAHPGELVKVVYTFETLEPLSDEWRVFAHFKGPGKGFFSDDHSPARPLSWWMPEQFIRYTRHVRVPPRSRKGTYELWVGLFRGDTRLEAKSTSNQIIDNSVNVASIKVEP